MYNKTSCIIFIQTLIIKDMLNSRFFAAADSGVINTTFCRNEAFLPTICAHHNYCLYDKRI